MTAQIIQFKPKEVPVKKQTPLEKQSELTKDKTNQQIFADVREDVVGEWQHAAISNKLSEYVYSKLPEYARGPKSYDYVNDLNVISATETKLNMRMGIFYPGSTKHNPVGWVAAFYKDAGIFVTPPDLASEQIARSLNIVLFVSFMQTLKSLGRM